VCFPVTERTGTSIYEGESTENLKSAIKIRTTARLSCISFNDDTHGLKSGRQVAVRYYKEILSHYVPFVFNKLRDKTYLKFSFDSPSYFECGQAENMNREHIRNC